MNWNTWVRRIHRWLSIVFTAAVIANFVAMGLGKSPSWVVYTPLPPLFLLLFTGLYLFALPYAAKWRSVQGFQRIEGLIARPARMSGKSAKVGTNEEKRT